MTPDTLRVRFAMIAVLVVACQQPAVVAPMRTRAIPDDATAPTPSDASVPDAGNASPPAALPSDLPSVVIAWNDAHTKHDAAALTVVYADEVSFYGAPSVTRAQCIKKKADAFAKSPDYAQSIRDARVMPDGNDGFYVTFVKDWTAEGKTASVGSYVYVDHRAHIIAEGDLPKTPSGDAWCQINTPDSWGVPTPSVVAPFRRSMLDVVRAVRASKYVADMKKKFKFDPIHVSFFTCPSQCTATSCEFDVELIAPQMLPPLGQFRGGRPTKVGQITLDLWNYAIRTDTGWEPL